MKKMILAAAAVLSLGMGAAMAQTVHSNSFNRLPSPAYTYDIPGG